MKPRSVRVRWSCALVLLGSQACVEDVWLGPEQRSVTAPATPDAGEAAPGSAPDGAAGEPEDASPGRPDGGTEPDDAGMVETPELREYCGLEDCFDPSLTTENCGSTRVCWPRPNENACAFTCEPAPRCGRAGDEPCPASTFCLFSLPGERCGVGAAGGFCAPYPRSCAHAAQGSACGCDGVTYASECDAARIGGVSVAHRGPCSDVAVIGTDAGDPNGGSNGGFAGN